MTALLPPPLLIGSATTFAVLDFGGNIKHEQKKGKVPNRFPSAFSAAHAKAKDTVESSAPGVAKLGGGSWEQEQ